MLMLLITNPKIGQTKTKAQYHFTTFDIEEHHKIHKCIDASFLYIINLGKTYKEKNGLHFP